MASREYSKVPYHATKDDEKESRPEVLVHDAKDRENSKGIGKLFLNYENSISYFILEIRTKLTNRISSLIQS